MSQVIMHKKYSRTKERISDNIRWCIWVIDLGSILIYIDLGSWLIVGSIKSLSLVYSYSNNDLYLLNKDYVIYIRITASIVFAFLTLLFHVTFKKIRNEPFI